MNTFLDFANITYLTPENAVFSLTDSGFAVMKAFLPPKKDDLDDTPSGENVWQELGRVWFHRMFPFEKPDEYISVLDKDGNEYGVIRRLSDFSGKDAEIISAELARKYYCPEIKSVLSMHEKLGNSYWTVDTDKGRMIFSMHDTFRNIIRISDTRIILCDTDGNRYSISDVTKLDKSSYRKIELFL